MNQTLKEFEDNIQKIHADLKAEFLSLRGSRPTVKMVEDIKVEAYGQKMDVKQLGSITLAPPREIDISVWDQTVVNAVAKAVADALEVNPSTEGNLIRVNLPPLTQERKEGLIKTISKVAEEARIKIRSFRDNINKKIDQAEDDKSIAEDEKFRYKEKAQKIVEETLDNKISEIKE